MEKENIDNFLENRQNYVMDNNSMQHLNVAGAGEENVGGVQTEVVSGVGGEILGGKYDEHHEEHDVGDDDELKYVEEVQQSEKLQQHKQQQLQSLKKFGLDDDGKCRSNELADRETSYNVSNEFGNGNGGFVFGGDHENYNQKPKHDLFKMGNGHNTNGHDITNINDEFVNNNSTEFEKKINMLESDIDDFCTSTSMVTEGFVPQINVEIEAKADPQEIIDEEEPSSLATNTTNGTSSLSENVPPQVPTSAQADAFDNCIDSLDNKENSNPHTLERPNELDSDESHSQLNPDAKEFVPSFASNPASPTSPFSTAKPQNEPILSEILETQMYFGQAPSVGPRHLIVDDDFVAESPRKGKCDNNMDTVSLPNELAEFEQEADKRPHELEAADVKSFNQRDEVMTPDQAIQQLPLDDLARGNHPSGLLTDFQNSNFIDHGPETCVDLDADSDLLPSSILSSEHDDVMKRSIYVAREDAIEDVLNSVQLIPTEADSVNNSFIEESATESAVNQLAGDKELLQVEEKEHVSNSPSTEEIQVNLQNTLNFSNKDISQLPIDMDNINNMKEYIEEAKQHIPQVEMQDDFQVEESFEQEPTVQDLYQNQTDEFPQHEYQSQTHDLLHHEPLQTDEYLHPGPEQKVYDEQQEQIVQPNLAIQNREQILNSQKEFQYEEQLEEPQIKEDMQQYNEEAKTQSILEECKTETHTEEQIVREGILEGNVSHHDLHLIEDSDVAILPTDINEPNLLADSTKPSMANENLMGDISVLREDEKNIRESISSFKIGIDIHEDDTVDDVMKVSFTADEKHLFEDTKEQQLISMSGLEQQMSGMMLNTTNDHLSQAEEVADTVATTAIEDNRIEPDEVTAEDELYQHQPQEQTAEQMLINKFNSHQEESPREEAQQEPQEDSEILTKSDVINESNGSVIEQSHQQELETEMIPVEEPIIRVEENAPMFTNEETEIENIINSDETQELAPCVIPETEPIEFLAKTETDNIGMNAEQQQHATEEIGAEITQGTELEDLKESEISAVKADMDGTPEVSAEVPIEATILAATAAVASTAAVVAKVDASESKSKNDTAKKPLPKATSTAAAKPKVASTATAKKPLDTTKKPIGVAAKPRTVPAKAAGTAGDKKPTTTAAARKPLSASTAVASKAVAKTTSSTATARTATATAKTSISAKPTTAPRTVASSTSAARKPAATNGPLAKPRPATAPAKPTTLGLPATNGAKPKSLSPRSTLTSHVRKIVPTTTAAKSPVKPTATNGVTKKTASSLASRTKTTTTTVSTTAGTTTKTFTARPAPKFTSSSSTSTTTTTTKRLAVAVSTISSSATTATKVSSTNMRKTTPSKPAAGRTPTKTSTTPGGLKSKSPLTKTASPDAKPAPIRKPVGNASVVSDMNNTAALQNGDLQVIKHEQPQQSNDTCIPMETEQQGQSFLEPRNESIPLDSVIA